MSRLVVYTSFSFLLDTFDVSLRSRYPEDHFHLVTFRDHPKRVFEKIKEETEAGVETADIVLGPHWMILNLQRAGLLRAYDSPAFAQYPSEFFDSRGAWCATALSPVGMAYNTNLVTGTDAPHTLTDATDSKWSGKLAVHEITNNAEGQMGLTYFTTLRRILGSKKWDGLVDRLAQLTTTGYQCMPDMALNIGLGHSYLGFPATRACVSYQVEMQEMPIKLQMPEDVPYMATFAPSVGLVKGSKNQEWGEKAFDFAISEDWQARVEGLGGKTPARPGSASQPLSAEKEVVYFPTLDDAANLDDCLQVLKAKLLHSTEVLASS